MYDLGLIYTPFRSLTTIRQDAAQWSRKRKWQHSLNLIAKNYNNKKWFALKSLWNLTWRTDVMPRSIQSFNIASCGPKYVLMPDPTAGYHSHFYFFFLRRGGVGDKISDTNPILPRFYTPLPLSHSLIARFLLLIEHLKAAIFFIGGFLT